MQSIHLTQHEIDKVVRFMLDQSGNDLSDKRALISSKMGALTARSGYKHFWELWDEAEQSTMAGANLRQRIIDELTTSYSYFYREHAHFALLTRLIETHEIPRDTHELRIWSAGCATGEEPYNLAMTIEDARRSGAFADQYTIVASDISTTAIEQAQAAHYDVANVARMPPHWRNLYCVRDGNGYTIKKSVAAHVTFRHESVFAPRPDAPFDVVVCRNMLIYFDRPSMDRFCSALHGRVRPGGYLFLGHTEIMGEIYGFDYLEPSVWRREG